MNYTLILPTGKIMTFYVESVAKMYQGLNGGTLVTKEALYNNSTSVYNTTIE